MLGEELIIADGLVSVQLVDIRGNKARIGIQAPRSMSVHRREVFDAIVREHGCKPLATFVEWSYDDETCPPKHKLLLELPSEAALRDAMCDGFVRFAPNSQLLRERGVA
jgi:carbon storage regulator